MARLVWGFIFTIFEPYYNRVTCPDFCLQKSRILDLLKVNRDNVKLITQKIVTPCVSRYMLHVLRYCVVNEHTKCPLALQKPLYRGKNQCQLRSNPPEADTAESCFTKK